MAAPVPLGNIWWIQSHDEDVDPAETLPVLDVDHRNAFGEEAQIVAEHEL